MMALMIGHTGHLPSLVFIDWLSEANLISQTLARHLAAILGYFSVEENKYFSSDLLGDLQ